MVHRSSSWQSWEQRFDDWICPLLGWKPNEKPPKVGKTIERLSIPREPTPAPTPNAQRSSVFDSIPTLSDWVVNPTLSERFGYSSFMTFVNKHALRYEDNRRKGGALWVITSVEDNVVTKQLKTWDFKYKLGKGWWRE